MKTGEIPVTTAAKWRPSVLPAVLAVVTLGATALAQPAEPTRASTSLLSGLEWTFVRIRYGSPMDRLEEFRRTYWSEPWAIDAPAAEQNLSRRIGRVTSIKVKEPILLELSDEALWQHPWIYFVEPANLEFTAEEVDIMREFLLRGGTATFDDFHGPVEWDLWVRQIRRVFPDRDIVKLTLDHPVFTCFYELNAYPQIPGLGAFFNNVTWEKGGYEPELHAIFDDQGRAMVMANFNTDMGDGWEWSNAEDYPNYIKFTAQSYRMVINEIVYALTH